MRRKISRDGAGGKATGDNTGRMEEGGTPPGRMRRRNQEVPIPLLRWCHSHPTWEWLLSRQDAGHGISCREGLIILVELAGDIREEGEDEKQTGKTSPR